MNFNRGVMKRLLILALLSLGTTFCLHRPQTLLAPKLKTSVNEYQPSAKNLARFMQDPEITNNPIIKNIVILSLLHWDAQIAFAERILEKDPDILLQIYRMLEILKNQHEQRVQEPDYPETSLEKLQSILFTDKAGDQIIVAIQYEARRMLAKKLSCTPGSLEDGTCQPLQPFKDKPYFAKKNWLEILTGFTYYEKLSAGDVPIKTNQQILIILSRSAQHTDFDLNVLKKQLKFKETLNALVKYTQAYLNRERGEILYLETNSWAGWLQLSLTVKFQAEENPVAISFEFNKDYLLIDSFNAHIGVGPRYSIHDSSLLDFLPESIACNIVDNLKISLVLEYAKLIKLKSIAIPDYIVKHTSNCRKELLLQAGFKEKRKHFWSSTELVYDVKAA